MSVINLADLKAHLAVLDDSDDELIADKLAVAEDYTEAMIGVPLEDFDPVPAPILEAIRMLVGHLYATREATIAGDYVRTVPFGFDALITPYREWAF